MISHIVYTSLICVIAPTFSFPAMSISDFKFDNPHKNFEIVEGPREFMMPLVPLGDILLPEKEHQSAESTGTSGVTDLNYMVYGKLYLMKAMKDISTRNMEQNNGRASSPFSNLEHRLTDRSISKLQNPDSLSFPVTTQRAKRLYRYKSWSKLNQDLANQQHNRRLEERSADFPSSSEKPQISLSSASTTVGTIAENVTDESSYLDAEDIELIKPYISPSPQIDGTPKTTNHTNIGLTEESNADFNSTNDNFEFDNRFLLKVPLKPNFMQCPEGQKMTHLGKCKAVLVQRSSSNSRGFGPTVIISNSASRIDRNNRRWDNLPRFELSTLFRSVVQLEKVLEKTIKDAEKQLGTKIQDEESSTTAASIDKINPVQV